MSGDQNVSKFIDYIKGKIEACIQKYMSLKQTMTYIHENHQICQSVTRGIWERLQRDNPDFFKEYNKRCEVAHQIATFNDLLAQQVYLMQKFREIELSTTAPVTQLQKPNDQHNHHQDQIHDQWIASNDSTYIEKLTYSLIDPSLIAAPHQSEPYTSGFGYNNDFEGLSFEQPHNLLTDRQELYYPQEDQLSTFFLPELQPLEYETWNNLDFGDGSTDNNGSDPTYDL